MAMTELKIDFDAPTVPRDFVARLTMLVRLHRLSVVAVCYRQTVHGWHVRVFVAQRVAFMRVILLQSLLGSDWKREAYNSRRALNWRHVPAFWRQRANVLYRRHFREIAL